MWAAGAMNVEVAVKLDVSVTTFYAEPKRVETGKGDANGRIFYSAKLAQTNIKRTYPLN
jgi:hypothetical protein